jgi:hypothetical protein
MLHDLIDEYVARLAQATRTAPRNEPTGVIDAYRSRISQYKPSIADVEKELESLYPKHDMGRAPFVILAVWSSLSKTYTRILSKYLCDSKWNGVHEVIVDLLSALKDADALDGLVRATTYRWEFDPSLQIPIKAVQGIAEIDTAASNAALEKIMQTTDEESIKTEAEALLQSDK